MNSKLISLQSIEYYEEYIEKYGKNALVLMQVGSFYEMYAVDFIDKNNKHIIRGPNLKELENLLDVCIAHKGPNKSIYDYNNPYMLGFPMVAEEIYIDKLINNGYTVITIIQDNQKQNNKTIIKRYVSNIYSPGTYIQLEKNITNYIVCIYIEEFKKKGDLNSYAFGLSSIDITTGKVYIYETYSKINDNEYCFDECLRFLNGINPSEIIIYKNNLSIEDKEIVKKFLLQEKNYQIKEYVNDYIKINYQKKIFEEIYKKNKNMIDIFENLNLSNKIYCRISLIHLIRYIKEHNTNLIFNLNNPELFFKDNNLLLGNDALNQLSIINKNDRYYEDVYNINSLLSIINIAGTSMGKRYIKDRFCNPLTNTDELNKIYNIVEELMKLDYKKIHNMIKNISDLERLYRKIEVKMIKYNKFVDFIKSFNSIIELFNYLVSIDFNEKTKTNFINMNNLKLLNNFVNYLNLYINIENSINYSNNNILNIFNSGIYDDIDQLQIQLKDNHLIINQVLDKLNDLFDDNKKSKSKSIILKQTKIKGYSYKTTLKRFEFLEKKLSKEPLIIDDGLTIHLNDFVVEKKKNVEFNLPFLQDNNKNINELLIKMDELIYSHFLEFLTSINNKHHKLIKYFINKITLLDYYLTIALISAENNYTKPIIEKYFDIYNDNDIILNDKINKDNKNINNDKINKDNNNDKDINDKINKDINDKDKDKDINDKDKYINDKDKDINDKEEDKEEEIINSLDEVESKSYIEVEELRHPIVEQLLKDKIEYKPHSLTIGKDINGIMLYGLNSAGKSVLMKAIGISIIMAQSGFYVPAKKFKYYPYNALYTRITGNDNIFKGLSSYMLEMVELNNIIKRADNRTLIIGDEICRGTEQISGNIIVASTIIKLLKENSNFIFATHLHDIMELDIIKKQNKLKAYHLTVKYENGKLIYDRELKEGVGDKIYGITVAEQVISNKEFKNIMVDVKKELIDDNKNIKYSKYNNSLIMDKCEICGNKNKNELITHHINFQKDCENGFVKNKQYIKMNDIINLVCICEKCHNKIHHGNLIIEGKKFTSNGEEIIYHYS